jgi:hypothetical protein
MSDVMTIASYYFLLARAPMANGPRTSGLNYYYSQLGMIIIAHHD